MEKNGDKKLHAGKTEKLQAAAEKAFSGKRKFQRVGKSKEVK